MALSIVYFNVEEHLAVDTMTEFWECLSKIICTVVT